MKKIILSTLLAVAMAVTPTLACTNFIITKGASTDGSVMVSYSADSHQLYGCLYKHNATKYNAPRNRVGYRQILG